MNISFELLSSMSPKIDTRHKPVKKGPTILALKKYFRKSLALDNQKNPTKNESIISIASTSSSSPNSSVKNKKMNETPIVISDSEASFKDNTPKKLTNLQKIESGLVEKENTRLSKEKILEVEQWIVEVNNANENVSVFSEVSTIYGDDNPGCKQPKTSVAVSSSILEPCEKRFDQFFKKKTTLQNYNSHGSPTLSNKQKQNVDVVKNSFNSDTSKIDDSLEKNVDDLQNNFKNILIDDSFKLNLDESFKTRVRNKELCKDVEFENQEIKLPDTKEYEELLDSLYGNSWRVKQDEVLPASEPRPIKSKEIVRKAPNTDKRPQKIDFNKYVKKDNDSNLLKVLQKARFKQALESPWTETLKKLCDSDTESDSSENGNVLSPVRLDFKDYDDNCAKQHTPSVDCNTKTVKNKTTTKRTPTLVTKSDKTTYSFLESLSGSTPIDKCDVSALIFRKQFNQQKDALAKKLFELYNEKVFESLLPQDLVLEWNDRMRGTAGTCVCKKITRRTGAIERTVKIVLAKKVLDSADRLRDTLIHELCHAATWIVNGVADGHGSFWKSWAYRAMKTFPELPPIKRCHTYVINTKYTYKCTGCGYSIGRHTKSLDTDRKRCGYCYGTFEILINKTSKKGETKSVPVTPKKPNDFALFVKDNYANFKTPNLKHGDVMKILGQKFSDLKVNKT